MSRPVWKARAGLGRREEPHVNADVAKVELLCEHIIWFAKQTKRPPPQGGGFLLRLEAA